MKNTNKYKYISLASIILMPFGATAVSAVESTTTTDKNEPVQSEVTDKASDSETKNELPSLKKNNDRTEKANKEKSIPASIGVTPLAALPTTMNWGGITISIAADGTLTIPGGTISNPPALAAFISKNTVESSKITKIVIGGPLTVTGNADSMFALFSATSIEGMSNLNTSGVTSMHNMFQNSDFTSLDLSHLDTSNVTDMSGMFAQSMLPTIDVSKFNTAKVTNMSGMFYSAIKVATLDISNFNTSNVTDMSKMFSYNKVMTSLNIKGINTANVTNMSDMFANSDGLTTLDVSGFNTAKVTSMSSMFAGLDKITTLNVSGFDTSNVTDMTWMFQGNKKLANLDVSKFKTGKVETMQAMFSTDAALTKIDVSNWDTSNVTNMNYLFYGTGVKELDVSHFNTAKVQYMDSTFRAIPALEKLDLSSFSDASIVKRTNMMMTGSALKELKLGNNFNMTSSSGLVDLPVTDRYSGKWQSVGTGTVDNPKGDQVYTSAELANNNFKISGADTYVWQKNAGSDVTVNYVDEEGNKIAEDSIVSGYYGDMFAVDPISISGYTFKEAQGGISSGSFTDSPQTITFVYTKDVIPGGDVTIKYVDPTGKKIADDTVLKGNIGETFTTPEPPVIKGYTYKELIQNPIVKTAKFAAFSSVAAKPAMVGTFTADPQSISFVYTKDPVAPVDPQKPVEKTIVKTVVKELPRTGVNENLSVVLSIAGITLISMIGLTTFKKIKN
ncbi:BspA family leucine-rich repeat surface protein [Lactobacillus sp. YT155]|uniref:BspA family leucine-rich repeat surface protein n=1 Tax=Lactobacillus sp. YT155 TaxID=3060955 RepID=UPI0026603143|nr:BspA family leucine-rich repeat surface protein [Lactobacillus sp. YT155]MDO1605288.1 BspA family leucine-rich repeat surface protein [Lactobacillus sp. YT155]